MAQEVLRQSNFTGGELDPKADRRRDLKAYASMLALSVNLMATPQGPVGRRPGLAHVDYIRGRLEPVGLDGTTITAPNGGEVSGLNGAGLVTATTIEATDPYVVCEVDFGAPVEVSLVDLIDFGLGDVSGGEGPVIGVPAPPQFPWRPAPEYTP